MGPVWGFHVGLRAQECQRDLGNGLGFRGLGLGAQDYWNPRTGKEYRSNIIGVYGPWLCHSYYLLGVPCLWFRFRLILTVMQTSFTI